VSTGSGTGLRSRSVDLGSDLRTTAASARAVALGGVALLTVSYGSVLYHFVDVSGSPAAFLLVAGLAVVAATGLSRVIRVYTAVAVGAVALAGGLGLYVASLPKSPPVVPLLQDAISLMTGRSLLVITNVDLWVLGVAPAPLFLAWYFALRRWYVTATLTGGATLGFLVLTGDASAPLVLLGMVGGAVAVGVGDVDRRGESLAVAEPLAVLLAGMILLSGVASVVPAGTDRTFDPVSGFQEGGSAGGGPGTVEASLIDAGSEIDVLGDISLSPEVRFSVRSSESRYWRVGSYDRYTGDGWIRTGQARPYGGDLDPPEGESRPVTQDYQLEDDLGVVPAAWRPVSVDGPVTGDLQVNGDGGVDTSGTLPAGSSYSVQSRVPAASPSELRSSGRNYSEEIVTKYTRVPSSTPERVAERTARITENADNPYDTARVVERWLKRNKEYSLDVPAPEGNVADQFLFEREAGYCTYFATTMVVMLRSQGIPARFTVGYTPGERVDSDEWVVRGYNAHAWVEVYFPDVGWVRFDPTPAGPREAVEESRLSEARENNASDADTDETRGAGEWTPTPTPTPVPLTPPDTAAGGTPDDATPGAVTVQPGAGDVAVSPAVQTADGFNASGDAASSEGGLLDVQLEFPSREESALGAVVLVGLVAGLRRLGVIRRIRRAVWLRYQPRSDPTADAERAFERLEYALERRYRPREPGETPRQYLASVGADERTRQVALVRERARYAGAVTREEVDEAVAIVDDLVSGRRTG